jgi:hypothetical protein
VTIIIIIIVLIIIIVTIMFVPAASALVASLRDHQHSYHHIRISMISTRKVSIVFRPAASAPSLPLL